jgi:type III pantothenate kinase
MLLAIDIGNTNTVVGVFDDEKLIASFRVTSNLNMTVDEAGLFVTSLFNRHMSAEVEQVDRVALCSVVPALTDVYEMMIGRYFDTTPLIINHKLVMPISIDYPHPEEIGADRLANATAGYVRVKDAVIVVDLGTAITFDIVSDEGTYLGGIIAPGTQTAGANLAQKAAQLFEVRSRKPEEVIGKSTAGAIKSGLYYGTIGVIDNILERIFGEMGLECMVLATGGEAQNYVDDSKYIEKVVPSLTLDGIRILADLNSGKKS